MDRATPSSLAWWPGMHGGHPIQLWPGEGVAGEGEVLPLAMLPKKLTESLETAAKAKDDVDAWPWRSSVMEVVDSTGGGRVRGATSSFLHEVRGSPPGSPLRAPPLLP